LGTVLFFPRKNKTRTAPAGTTIILPISDKKRAPRQSLMMSCATPKHKHFYKHIKTRLQVWIAAVGESMPITSSIALTQQISFEVSFGG
jgi:hypothetical protein